MLYIFYYFLKTYKIFKKVWGAVRELFAIYVLSIGEEMICCARPFDPLDSTVEINTVLLQNYVRFMCSRLAKKFFVETELSHLMHLHVTFSMAHGFSARKLSSSRTFLIL